MRRQFPLGGFPFAVLVNDAPPKRQSAFMGAMLQTRAAVERFFAAVFS